MSAETRWFESLSPLPGGAQRLRLALRTATERANPWRPAFAACVLGLIAGLALRWIGVSADSNLAPAIAEAARARPAQASGWLEVPGARPDVRLYLAMEAPPSRPTVSER